MANGNCIESNQNARSVVPIPASIQPIRGYPNKLIIFRVAASPFWWCRCWHDGRHHKRSTKTELKRQAIAFAKQFFSQLVSQQLEIVCRSKRQQPTSFVALATAVIKEDELKAERGELSLRYVRCQQQRMEGVLFAAFGDRDITEIDYAAMDELRTDLFRRGLSNSTIRLHFASLNKVIAYAQRIGIISSPPIKPRVKQIDNARGYFELKEYQQLRRACRHLLGTSHSITQVNDGAKAAGQALRRVTITEDVLYLIPFMVYSFIRPTDLRNMQHKHVEVRRGEHGDYLYLPIPTSKLHDKPITSMPRAAWAYQRLLAYQQQRGFGGDDDYLFLPEHANRTTAYRTLTRQFDVVLNDTQLRVGNDGSQRTLYSLRHTAIMYRLMFGGDINLLTLARNARTSVAMIERFYASQLEAGHVISQLHQRR